MTGNLRQRIQLLIVGQFYGGLFYGKMRLFPPHKPPALSELIAKNRGDGFAEIIDSQKSPGQGALLPVYLTGLPTPIPEYVGLGAVIAAAKTILTLLLQFGPEFRTPR